MSRIHNDTVQEVKSRVNIYDVVLDYVTLKRAGVDSFKGLCPFHDERTPSFHVRPSMGLYNCFGCQESGDAIAFVQAMDHLSFVETIERLAARVGVTVKYEEGAPEQDKGPRKTRLYEAHAGAAAYYASQMGTAEGQTARQFMHGRAFDDAALQQFGVGYAPRGWTNLADHLRGQGFTAEELLAAGLVSQGRQGVFDRFRGRVMWPIKDTSGQTVGFGARKLYDDDEGPKYLNTSETPIYHKSSVLYGIERAKKTISRQKQVILVEGYTDVMACHLAGVTNAIATSGTAFGADHIAVIRRVLGDDPAAEVIFTFDPDAAGQAAALKAFSHEAKFRAQTYVVISPDGLDPSDLRQQRGDAAVREIFKQKRPLFAFALEQAVQKFDLNSVEGRANALRAAAPIVAGIRDVALRPGYTRELAGMLGEDPETVRIAVQNATRNPQGAASGSGVQPGLRAAASASQGAVSHAGAQSVPHPVAQYPGAPSQPYPMQPPAAQAGQTAYQAAQQQPPQPMQPQISLSGLPNTPEAHLERDALTAMLQLPTAIPETLMQQACAVRLKLAPFNTILQVITANIVHRTQPDWVARITSVVPANLQGLVRELSVTPIRVRSETDAFRFAKQIIITLVSRDLLEVKDELLRRLQRLPATDEAARGEISKQINLVEKARRAVLDQAEA